MSWAYQENNPWSNLLGSCLQSSYKQVAPCSGFTDHKLLKSEEDLTPIPRQRSNTLPKSFGSQLEKKPTETKAPKPPVESTLEAVMNKLQEKRKEAGRPEDIKVRFQGFLFSICPHFIINKCMNLYNIILCSSLGHDPWADRSRKSVPSESSIILREHPWQTSEYPILQKSAISSPSEG